MEFKEGFNPGQNNTYTEVNFGPNLQYLPNVTELTIVNGGTLEDKKQCTPKTEGATNSLFKCMDEPDSNKDLTATKSAVLNYVSRIAHMLKPEKMQGWERFWKGLLDIEIIEKDICKISKQQGTTFNRILICEIIHHLDRRGFYKDPYNASAMTRVLEGDDKHSIRTHGLNWYPNENICKHLDNYIEEFKL